MCLLGRERYAPEHRVVRVKNRQPIYRADGNRKNSRSKKDSKCGEYEKQTSRVALPVIFPFPFLLSRRGCLKKVRLVNTLFV